MFASKRIAAMVIAPCLMAATATPAHANGYGYGWGAFAAGTVAGLAVGAAMAPRPVYAYPATVVVPGPVVAYPPPPVVRYGPPIAVYGPPVVVAPPPRASSMRLPLRWSSIPATEPGKAVGLVSH